MKYAILINKVWTLRNEIPVNWSETDPFHPDKVKPFVKPEITDSQYLGDVLILDTEKDIVTLEVFDYTVEQIKKRELANAWSIDPDQLLIQMAIEGIGEQTILDAIKTLPKEMQLPANVKYKRAKNFHRDNPLLNMVWEDLEKSQNELDQFFINAKKIE